MSRHSLPAAVIVALLALLAAPFVFSSFTVSLLNYIGVYALVAIGLALLTGVAGIVSFGQAAFVGVAAYATAWLSAINGYSPWLGLILAIVVTCMVAAALGAATLLLPLFGTITGTKLVAGINLAWGLVLWVAARRAAGGLCLRR